MTIKEDLNAPVYFFDPASKRILNGKLLKLNTERKLIGVQDGPDLVIYFSDENFNFTNDFKAAKKQAVGFIKLEIGEHRQALTQLYKQLFHMQRAKP